MKYTLTLLFISYAFCASHNYPFKRLAGPPEEFETKRIPNPSNFPVIESAGVDTITLTSNKRTNGIYYASTIFYVDTDNFEFALVSEIYQNLKLILLDPNMNEVPYNISIQPIVFGPGVAMPSLFISINNTLLGNYTLLIEAYNVTGDNLDIMLAWENNPKLQMKSYLQSFIITINSNVTIYAELISVQGNKRQIFDVSIKDAVIEVLDPTGDQFDIPMNDNGLNGDSVAGDNIWTGQLKVDESGNYIFSPSFLGTYLSSTYNGVKQVSQLYFQRTVGHLITVSNANLVIHEKVKVIKLSPDVLGIIMYIKNNNGMNNQYRAYTELYGYDNCGDLIPVAWLGGIYDLLPLKCSNRTNCKFPVVYEGKMTLELDKNWTKRVNICDGVFLKNTYLADINTSYPVVTYKSKNDTFIKFDDDIINELCSQEWNIRVSQVMREGKNPYVKDKSQVKKTGLVMLPGYCASVNPWLASSAQFTDAYYFPDTYINLPNIEYANQVLNWVNQLKLDSFGIIAHSQGGLVALTIMNYYFTPLNEAKNFNDSKPTVYIQSIGSPYQGTPLADNAASIEYFFGAGCGANSDLSITGTANWITGISQFAIQRVFYYTTTGSPDPEFKCNFVTDLFLEDFNDGITELSHALLPDFNVGKRYMGNSYRECHTTDMNYPAQYLNTNRNSIMNASAAR